MGSFLKHHRAPAHILSGEPDIHSGVAARSNAHHVAGLLGVLLANDGIRSLRQRRTGEDPGALTWTDRAGGKRSGGDRFDDPELARLLGAGAAHIVRARRVA